jgi:hypothetical protein
MLKQLPLMRPLVTPTFVGTVPVVISFRTGAIWLAAITAVGKGM